MPGRLVGETLTSIPLEHRMVARLLFAAAGLMLLTFAAGHLVLGSSRLSSRIRISPIVVGAVVIGLGTSVPEAKRRGTPAVRPDRDRQTRQQPVTVVEHAAQQQRAHERAEAPDGEQKASASRTPPQTRSQAAGKTISTPLLSPTADFRVTSARTCGRCLM
jgi:hypothetical protein